MIKKMFFTLGLGFLMTTAIIHADEYLGIKYGAVSTDNSVYGNNSGEVQGPYIKYDDLSLVGIDYRGIKNYDNHLSFGAGLDLMTKNGDFFKGGTLDLNLYAGTHFKDFKLYTIIGYGIQSLSDYTVAKGIQYGIGSAYDITNYFAILLDYKINKLETTDNDEYTANQSYKLSGFYLTVAYKF